MHSQSFHQYGKLHTCPDCHRQSLAQPSPVLYKCLKCGFRRNISRHNAELPLPAFLVPFMLIFLFLL
jgi:ribosomal protein L37AE/L43A